ncbi:hypothetical protein EW146_g2715 [Bondarzewia mesenterica]|uniref:J domain-containing protein n=1 Tax=Bondarzewia mesenterica TaxID=1095465 RepID=A0A4S4M220_9AGAM|nr:hypothetical protein EW146_g2715 [Bondarzewia mesenterica]
MTTIRGNAPTMSDFVSIARNPDISPKSVLCRAVLLGSVSSVDRRGIYVLDVLTESASWVKCGTTGHSPRDCTNDLRSQYKFKCSACGGTDHVTFFCSIKDSKADEQTDFKPSKSQKTTPKPASKPARKPKAESTNPDPQQNPKAEPANPDLQQNPKVKPANLDLQQKTKAEPANPDLQQKRLAEQLKTKGNHAFKSEDFETAIDYYTQAIKWYDRESIYHSNRAAAYIAKKRFRLALADCHRAVALQSDHPTAKVLVRLGRCHFSLGAIIPALSALRQAIVLEPGNSVALSFRKKAVELQSHIDDFEGARSRNHWRMAQSAYEKCIQIIEEEEGDVPIEWTCWGIEVEIARGNWEEASGLVESAIQEHPNCPDLTLLHALVLFLTGTFEYAARQILTTLRMDPDSRKAKQLRLRVRTFEQLKAEGNEFFGDSQWRRAIDKYNEALQIVSEKLEEGNGGHIRALLLSNRAAAYVKLNQYKEARSDIKSSLTLHPTFFKAIRCRARINLHEECYDAAIEDFKQAIEYVRTEAERRALQAELNEAERMAAIKRNKRKNHYDTLGMPKALFVILEGMLIRAAGLTRTCSVLEIKKAYKRESLKHHPDKVGLCCHSLCLIVLRIIAIKGGNEERFKLVVEAYAILSDPLERSRHDAELNKYTSYSEQDDYDWSYFTP